MSRRHYNRTPSHPYRSRAVEGRNRLPPWLIALIVILLVAGIGLFLALRGGAAPAPTPTGTPAAVVAVASSISGFFSISGFCW